MFKFHSFIFLFVLLIGACQQHAQPEKALPKPAEAPQKKKGESVASKTTEQPDWVDDKVLYYLDHNKDRLSSSNTAPLTYLSDISNRDGRSYYMVKIGNIKDEHFSTAQWILIDSSTRKIYELDIAKDTLKLWVPDNRPKAKRAYRLPDGIYRFDMVSAEYHGMKMADLWVKIYKNSVEVIVYSEGLSHTKKGDILDKGMLRLHKSGEWIIAHSESDVLTNEIGGCSGGPVILDFSHKKYLAC